MEFTIYNDDCLNKLKQIPDNSIDSIVTDPPYEIGFMGKRWDATGVANNVNLWIECNRILKPGGHLLAFSSTRTYHKLASSIENAEFQIKDMIAWSYGSGFPKSLNINKAIYKLLGHGYSEYEGYGTSLKPAIEPIVLARKIISEKTIVENVLKYGTGGINIDGCRIGDGSDKISGGCNNSKGKGNTQVKFASPTAESIESCYSTGRFPANFIHDGSDEVKDCFPDTKPSRARTRPSDSISERTNFGGGYKSASNEHNDNGGNASRFFKTCEFTDEDNKSIIYIPKTSQKERHESGAKNEHPTLKPIKLMQYLCKLITPKNGVVLDPFMGSGTTGIGAIKEGFNFIGIEKEIEYYNVASQRLEYYNNEEKAKVKLTDFFED